MLGGPDRLTGEGGYIPELGSGQVSRMFSNIVDTSGDDILKSAARPESQRRGFDQTTEGLLTVREAAALLHVHGNTIRRWTNDGKLKAYRIGTRRDRRFKQEDILRFLEQTSAEPEE